MELWMWIIAGSLAIGGFMSGYFFARSSGRDASAGKEKAKVLETEVVKLKTELSQYREQVAGHFRTTAELVHEMTQSYKAVYDHMANGSQKLCSGEVMMELDEAPRLTTSSTFTVAENKDKDEAPASTEAPIQVVNTNQAQPAATFH